MVRLSINNSVDTEFLKEISVLFSLLKRKLSVVVCLIMFLVFAIALVEAKQTSAIIFEDNFDGKTLDSKKWVKTYYDGNPYNPVTGEIQYYKDENVTVKGGRLRITTVRKDVTGYDITNNWKRKTFHYTSGIISSRYVISPPQGDEVIFIESEWNMSDLRGKMALWPAFWLISANNKWPPEVDIMEALGQHETYLFTAVKAGKNGVINESLSPGQVAEIADLFKKPQRFGLEWTEDSMTFYRNGKPVYYKDPKTYQMKKAKITDWHVLPKVPMRIIANVALGGSPENSWPGTPDKTTKLPVKAHINYIRVYRRNPYD